MGKNKKRKRSKGRNNPPPTSVDSVATVANNNNRSSSSLSGTSFHKSGRVTNLPCAFPSHLPRPATGFLRNEAPFQASFAAALDTAYEGFVVDDNVSATSASDIETTLQTELRDCFRADVTQPFGLGTKCAKTYVTRCLVGEFGTTYKVCVWLRRVVSSVLRCPPSIQLFMATTY